EVQKLAQVRRVALLELPKFKLQLVTQPITHQILDVVICCLTLLQRSGAKWQSMDTPAPPRRGRLWRHRRPCSWRVTRVFSQKASGVAARWPELERVLDELEAGDVRVVTKLDRLAPRRSTC